MIDCPINHWYRENNGPNIDPCGTPALTLVQ